MRVLHVVFTLFLKALSLNLKVYEKQKTQVISLNYNIAKYEENLKV
jgi:hypothetical protein